MVMARGVTEPGGRRGLLLGAAAVVAVLVAVAGWWLTQRGDPSPRPGGGGVSASPSPSEAGASACGLPDGSQKVPSTAAPETTWTLTHRMAVPSATAIGPGRESAGIHSCFARNPAGALFATANLYADVGNPAVNARQAYEQRAIHDTTYDQVIDETPDRGPENGGSQIAGYRFSNYSTDEAQVVLVFRLTEGPDTGALIATTYSMRWDNGDWKAVIPPVGTEISNQVASLNGFVEWSGT